MDATQLILDRFEQVSAVPRGTKREEKISQWLQDWAQQHRLESRVDAHGNMVIYVPASPGLENSPTLVLQGHMDMVCEKTPDSDHDFTRDPIRVIRQGDWLTADHTTLGADNGIAIAIALALAEDKEFAHPPLELLFTVEEEVGLGGVSDIEPGMLRGKLVINLDTEEEGTFIVGCAGGTTTHIDLPIARQEIPSDFGIYRLQVGGLQGGHSGVDIHKHRASANKILGRALDRLAHQVPLQLVSLKGGSARNAISREAEAIFAVPRDQEAGLGGLLDALGREVQHEYEKTDAGLTLSFAPHHENGGKGMLDIAGTEKIIRLLMALPSGVVEMSSDIEGFVETSSNLAILELKDDLFQILTNQRSMTMSRLDEINRRVEAMARLSGAQVLHDEAYPSWQPDMESPLLKRSVEVFESRFGKKPEVRLIHAGLECGILSDRCGGLDMVSLGPTILGVHSPDEKLYIPSVIQVWDFLRALIRSLTQEPLKT
jgi:dipeptidase D